MQLITIKAASKLLGVTTTAKKMPILGGWEKTFRKI